MLSYDEALHNLNDRIQVLSAEPVQIEDSLGLNTHVPTIAPFDMPLFTNSAMDGFAVRAADLSLCSAENPVSLRISGETRAGGQTGELARHSAMRIMTGAPVPIGADCVVPVEDVQSKDGFAVFKQPAFVSDHLRYRGDDVSTGDVLIPSATTMTPARIALSAMFGITTVVAVRRPSVAILTTGDEIVEPGRHLETGQIYNSNRFAIQSMLRELGIEPALILHAKDTEDSTRQCLLRCASCDVVVSTGGVSMGEYDLVRKCLGDLGKIDFWRAAIRPGKPFVFGSVGEAKFFGLPGNPVSTMVTFELYVRPMLRKMCGFQSLFRPIVRVPLAEDYDHVPGRRDFVRVTLEYDQGVMHARPIGGQGSGALKSMADCDGLAVINESTSLNQRGTVVPVWLMETRLQSPDTLIT